LRRGLHSCAASRLNAVALFPASLKPEGIELAGLLIMLVTPVVRVAVAMVLFFREKDWRYSWTPAGVLLILLLGSVLGIGEPESQGSQSAGKRIRLEPGPAVLLCGRTVLTSSECG